MSQALGLLGVALLVVASAYFVAMEFAFTAANPSRLADAADAGDRKATASLRVLKRLSFCLSGAQLGITFAALLTGFVAEPVFAVVFEPLLALVGVPEGGRKGVSLTLAFVVSTFALMVLGELAPKNLAIAIPEPVARSLARSTLVFMSVGGPVIRLFDGAANMLLKRLGITPIQESHGTVTSEDLSRIIDSAEATGNLSPEEAGLLSRALEFGGLTAGDVMVPRPRVVTVDHDARGKDLRQLLRSTGHSRVPVTQGATETVTGVVSVKDFMDLPMADREVVPVSVLAKPVLRVLETASLANTTEQMRLARTQFAVAVDEFGDDVGIVTLEDILEELVGEVREGVVGSRRPFVAGEPLRVSGSLRRHEVARRTGVQLPDGDYDTLAGLVLARLGRLAQVGDELTVTVELVRPDGSDLPPRAMAALRVESLVGRTVGDVLLTVKVGEEPW